MIGQAGLLGIAYGAACKSGDYWREWQLTMRVLFFKQLPEYD